MTTSEAMLFRSYDDVVFCILHDVTSNNMFHDLADGSLGKLASGFLHGSALPS